MKEALLCRDVDLTLDDVGYVAPFVNGSNTKKDGIAMQVLRHTTTWKF